MNKIKEYFVSLHLDYKKELAKLIVSNTLILIICSFAIIYFKQMIFILVGVMILVLLNYFFFSSYKNQQKQNVMNHDEEFVTIINYFQLFIKNKYNVYQSLNAIINYASLWMQEQLTALLRGIDEDKSVKPYITFAKKFNQEIIENVMVSIYQMVDEGENEMTMLQFHHLFAQMQQSYQAGLIDKKEKSMSGLSTFPLVGAGSLTILLMFGIITLMGEMVSVL
ncbi:MAG: hypothetical protein SO176_00420 [Bacilli bacterium]|nr:hypothetical protein [Bacilli bacterium]